MSYTWTFRDDFTVAQPVRDLLNGELWESAAETVKQNSRRTVYHVPASGKRPGLFIKRNYSRRLRDIIKNLWRMKSCMEYRSGIELMHAGIPAVRVLAWGQNDGDCCLVTEELEGAVSFRDAWHSVIGKPDPRRRFIEDLGDFLAVLFRGRICHPDLHAGNILVVKQGGDFVFRLVDLYGVRITERFSSADEQHILGWLSEILWELTLTEIRALLKPLLKFVSAVEDDPLALAGSIFKHRGFAVRKRWPGRRRRLLQESSLCHRRASDRGRWLLRKPFTFELGKSLVEQHLRQVSDGVGVLKVDRKRRLTRVSEQGRSFIVKEYLIPGPWGRWRSDCRSWLNTYHIAMIGIPVPRCHAWLRGSDGRGYIILEDMGKEHLAEWLADGCGQTKRTRDYLENVARFLAWLHASGIVHRDLKTSNLIVRGGESDHEGESGIALVDCDDVSFSGWNLCRGRMRNLAQVLEAVDGSLSSVGQIRFLVRYRRAAGLSRDQLRELLE